MKNRSWGYCRVSVMMRIVLLCVCFNLFSFSLFSQKNAVDSIRKELDNEKNDTLKVQTLYFLSEALWRVGQYDTAISCADQSRTLIEKLG